MDQWGTGGCGVREIVAGCRGIHECQSHTLMVTAAGCLEGLANRRRDRLKVLPCGVS